MSGLLPSPLVGEGGAKRRMRGSLRAHRRSLRHTPHPSELLPTSVAALSHKGRGHINAHRACCPIAVCEITDPFPRSRRSDPAQNCDAARWRPA
ncbi:hypothetical protein C7U89_06740 [Bradyrhizobium sp. WBOS4]|nr:hypothetical protein [Bradyrhizobium sp. WBOS8]MDD1582650.1 hypothetical protein [Bradyrhizobium sp. WBOS4]